MRRLKTGLILSPLLLLAACGQQELYGQLEEQQANEMISALRKENIEAGKAPGEKGVWAISVDPSDFSRSVEVLRSAGLPRDRFASLGQVFEKKGFVSSPMEERARLIFGLSQELSHTVSEIDGVVQARVHLAIPEPDPLSDKLKPSSAAVFIKYQPGFDLRNQTGAIKSLVINSVEGLSYDKVSVVMFPSKAIQAKKPATFAQFAPPLAPAALVMGGLATVAFGFGRRRRRSGLPAERG